MNYRDYFRKIYDGFGLSLYDIDSEIDFVIELLTGLTEKDFILGKIFDDEQREKFSTILNERVKTGRPIQQIMGRAFFAGDKFFVSEYTLIPRPETEFLVDICCKNYVKTDKLRILDIGTGSGCIAIELAKYFINSYIEAVDICQESIDIAKKNSEYFSLSDRVHIYKSDVFSSVKGLFDIIVSNPPYIPWEDKKNVQKDVLVFEPANALFAEDEGLFFYKKIIKESSKFLRPGGLLAFELGIEQGKKVYEILKKNGFKNIILTKDCDNIDRVISANFSIVN